MELSQLVVLLVLRSVNVFAIGKLLVLRDIPSVDSRRGLLLDVEGMLVLLEMVRVVRTMAPGRWIAVVVLLLRPRLCPTPNNVAINKREEGVEFKG